MDQEFLSLSEIGKRLEVSPQTLREWIRRGMLPAVKIGRAFRVRREDVEALIEAYSVTPSVPSTFSGGAVSPYDDINFPRDTGAEEPAEQ